MRRGVLTGLALATAAVLASACGGSGGSAAPATASGDPAKVSGNITVLTNRTDLVNDGTMKKYADDFAKAYPNVRVTFEGITDYEGEVKIRMNSENYGDVLLIPNAIAKGDYPKFFAPLGSAAELSKKYKFTQAGTVNDQVYGIVSFTPAQGFVYNKELWDSAGVTEWPKTPEEFLSALKAVKDKTGATPLYTNYKDGWPLSTWTNALGSVTCDVKAEKAMITEDPWAPGKDLNVIDSLLFDAVNRKLTEKDPTTTNWEESKNAIATGKIGAMWLGSWAVPQMQAAATKAGKSPETIGFMPFPAQANGKFCTVLAPDYQYAVNTHSQNKAAARAWVDWFVDKSGFSALNQGVSSLKSDPLPSAIKPLGEAGVQLIEMETDQRVQVDAIDKESEVGIKAPEYRQRLIDVARGAAKGDLNSVLAELSGKWKAGQESAG
ncbi:ABC transporter substrate-binding protein [Planobispora siamensis]|uniref:Sugar ABC transporter substrate-binding protein n=1 Tax=Planobispora siamensis TaxID=936338 RepID=A0A8J3WPD0_9ACTN|nr:extracellular solute-binding protein [Planobispora siamensis]GIH94771.1 sugar ABC transporter substrate-binding protein [Planobispora siamensis]